MDIATVIGLVAAVCSTFAIVPQVIKAIRTKETKSISLGMYIIVITGVLLWLTYGILKSDVPIILANVIGAILVSTMIFLKIKYG